MSNLDGQLANNFFIAMHRTKYDARGQWHASIGDATLADAILDRLMHNAHRIEHKGTSMRKIMSRLDSK